MFASRPAHPSAAYLLRPCLVVAAAVPAAARGADSLPDPHGKLADLAKPVTVFILMGQSNMLGFGKIAGADKEGTLEHATKTAGLYPYLVDDAGNWTTRNDIRKVRVMVGRGGGMGVHANDWLSIKGKAIGPEVGIGHELGHLLEPDVHLDRIEPAATSDFTITGMSSSPSRKAYSLNTPWSMATSRQRPSAARKRWRRTL
jgi:hypothetical protein